MRNGKVFSKNNTGNQKMPRPNSSFADDDSGQTSARRYPPADVKYLYGAAAGRCAFPGCRKFVLLPGLNGTRAQQVGKIAHIVAHSDNGPRGDPNYPREKLDTYENWILLCPTCHDTVDAHPDRYSCDYLHQLKNDHEAWVNQLLSSSMTKVTFSELEIAVAGIRYQNDLVDNSLEVVAPEEKIKINHLSRRTKNALTIGLSQAPLVQSFFIAMEKADGGFEKRLVQGFRNQYLRLKTSGEKPDEIFDDLFRFSSANSPEFPIQAAGLALLSHLFEKCDIFERTEEEEVNATAY